MNMPLLKGYIEMAARVLPWERVGAMVGNLILSACQSRNPGLIEMARRYISKARHQLAVLEAALIDGKISAGEAALIMGAWEEGEPTPVELEDKVLK